MQLPSCDLVHEQYPYKMKSKFYNFDFVQFFLISLNFVYGQFAKMNEFDIKQKTEIETFQYRRYLAHAH